MGRYVRIELCFDGENQECGVFQALDDTGITKEQYFNYTDYFEKELISPTVDSPCWFFFTVDGIRKFLPVFKDILDKIVPHGWDFDLILMETDMEPIYKDQLQAAWHYDERTNPPTTTKNVSASDDMETVINDFIDKGNKEG